MMRIVYSEFEEKDHFELLCEFKGKYPLEFGLPYERFRDGFTDTTVAFYLEKFGYKYQLGSIGVRESQGHPAPPTIVFKVLNPDIFHYLIICPLRHEYMFMTSEDMSESEHPDKIFAKILRKTIPDDIGINIITKDDQTSVMEMIDKGTGAKFIGVDNRDKQYREKEAEEVRKRLWGDKP